MSTVVEQLQSALPPGTVLTGADARSRPAGWSLPDGEVLCVLRPDCTEDVAAALGICHAAGQAVVTQGGKTGLVNGARAVDGEVVLSMERMNRIESIDTLGRTITVEAGAVLQTVQEAAEANELFMPLDLGGRGSATIGGIIATNAGGNGVIRYGMMREQVLGLEVVLADGTIVSSMNRLLKNNTGYDLKHLFIGSEGTLGIITRAVLRLRPLLPASNSALVATDSFGQLARLLGFMERELGGRMSAFEAMWNNYYRLASHAPHLGEPPLADSYPYYALIESTGNDAGYEAQAFTSALERALETGLLTDAVLAQSEREREAFWNVRDNVGCMAALGPNAIFDVSVTVSEMEPYLARCRLRLEALLGELRWVTFGHLGDGNLHLAVGIGVDDPARKKAVEQIIYDELAGIGGSVSAEHGIGLDKRDFLGISRTPVEIALMQGIKRTLDPKNILNPDRIFRRA